MINILANRHMIDADWCYHAFKEHIDETHKVVIIPFTFRPDKIYSTELWKEFYGKESGLYYDGIVDSFKRYGILEENITWISYFEDSNNDAKNKVNQADIIYIPGGLPDQLMNRLEEYELIDQIEKHSGVIIGYSAGAMVQLNKYHITPDADYDTFTYQKGLNIINHLNIEVHYEGTGIQLESIKRVIEETNKPVYAMEDEGAIIVQDDQVTQVGKVHYFGL